MDVASMPMPDPEVFVSAAEMNDPELLAELAAITGGAATPPPTLKHEAIEEQIKAKKREAIIFKKASNLPAAKSALAEAKALEARLATGPTQTRSPDRKSTR